MLLTLLRCAGCERQRIVRRRSPAIRNGCLHCHGQPFRFYRAASLDELRDELIRELERDRVPLETTAVALNRWTAAAQRRQTEQTAVEQARRYVRDRYPHVRGWLFFQIVRTRLRRQAKARRRTAEQKRLTTVAERRARAELAKVADRIDRAPYLQGYRRATHWAPDRVFADRRLGDRLERDRSHAGAPRAALKRQVRGQLTKAERRDPTCGGFYRPADTDPRVFAHARRAQQRVDDRKRLEGEAAARMRAGVRRRPAVGGANGTS